MSSRLNRRQFVRRTAVAAGAVAAGAVATGLHAPTIVRAASAGQWGDLVGRLVYDGEAPLRKKLTVDKDVECCGKFDIRDESLMVGEQGGLGNVYVYVRSSRVEICPELEEQVADEKQVVLDNRDCIFKPHCMKIWYSKQVFHIVNSDPVGQNVAFRPMGDVEANIVLKSPPAEGAKADWTFKRKQRIPVPIACNYHSWESAYVLPFDSPYVDVTQMDGTFRIAKLPVGELEFQFWQERIGYLNTPQWKKGRLKMAIRPGVNDLGTIQVDPALLVKKT